LIFSQFLPIYDVFAENPPENQIEELPEAENQEEPELPQEQADEPESEEPPPEHDEDENLDIYPPIGSIALNDNQPYTLENNLEIMLEGYHDPDDLVVDGGKLYYKIGQTTDLDLIEYEEFNPDHENHYLIEESFDNGFGSYTIYFRLKDEAGNESEIYFDSIDYLEYYISANVIIDEGSSFLGDYGEEVVDEEVLLSISGMGNNSIESYAVELVDNFENAEWIDFEVAGKDVSETIEFDLNASSGIQTVYLKLKDEFGNISNTFSHSVYLNYQDIKPSIESNLDKILFAGESDVSVTVTNTGSDLSYHNSLRIEFPKGFHFVETEKDQGQEVEEDYLSPTFVGVDDESNQYIEYVGIADLLPGESKTIEFKLRAGGKKDGYKLLDKVDINVNAKSYKKGDENHPVEITEEIESELVPYFVYISSIGGNTLVGDESLNRVKIRTNPEISSIEDIENGNIPFTLRYTLSDSIEYLDNSIDYINYIGDEADILFTKHIEEQGSSLEWLFGKRLGINYYLNPLEFVFSTIIPKQKSNEEFVQHDESLEYNLSSTGYYSNYSKDHDEYEEVAFSSNWDGGGLAKYFKVKKYSSQSIINPGDEIRYSIKIDVSNEYDLNEVELSDILPDGIRYVGDLEFEEGLWIELVSSEVNSEDGKQYLIWRINAEEGIVAGSTIEFDYMAQIESNYQTKSLEDDSRIHTSDSLRSNITLSTIWEDVDRENLREGLSFDSDSIRNVLPRVEFDLQTRLNDGELIDKDVVNIRVGDIVKVIATINFPSSTPTGNFSTQFYLPQGTRLVSDFGISYSGTFGILPEIEQGLYGGYDLNVGNVEPDSKIVVEYDISFDDKPLFKSGVQARNLFRAQYFDIHQSKKTHSDEIGFRIIEPKIQISKSVKEGYLARGEEAQIELTVRNIGEDIAYNLNFIDSIPQNSELMPDSYTLSNGISVNYLDGLFTSDLFDLGVGESVVLSYRIKLDNDLIYGDSLTNHTELSSYRSRRIEDSLPHRDYPAQETIHNWKSKEPLLATRIYRNGFENVENVPIGREDNAEIIVDIRNVGGAPVYDVGAHIDFSNAMDSYPDIVFECRMGNELVAFDSIESGKLELNIPILIPSKKISCSTNISTTTEVQFGEEYEVGIVATGKDTNLIDIRLDGSEQTSGDFDEDDSDRRMITTTKLDNEPPIGDVRIKAGGEQVEFTNQSDIEVEYSATEPTNANGISSRIVGVRFSSDGTNWSIHNNLDLLDSPEIFSLEGEWNDWDGSIFTLLNSLPTDDKYYYYMEVVDLYENRAIISANIIRDSIAPDSGQVSISPIEGDMSDPELTMVKDNFVNIALSDSTSNISSGVGSYQYSFDNLEWSDWIDYLEPISVVGYNLEPQHEIQTFEVWVRSMDRAGNISEVFRDIITYIEEDNVDPIGEIGFSNQLGQEVQSTNNLSQLTVEYTASDFGSQEIRRIRNVRFSSDGFNWHTIENLPIEKCVGNNPHEEDCNNWDGSSLKLPYPQLDRNTYEGVVNEFMEIRDFAGNIAIVRNSFIYDVTPPGEDGMFYIGRSEYDWSNPNYTNSYNNYLVYEVFDNRKPIDNPERTLNEDEVSGIKYVRFSIDNKNYSPWVEYDGMGLGSYLQKWVRYYYGVPWMGYMQVMDGAGNVGTHTYSDSILYLPTKNLVPEISMKINNDESHTPVPIVALKVIQGGRSSDFALSKIRFKYCNNQCNEDDEWSVWKEYSDSIIDVVKSPNTSGRKNIFVQVMNTEGFVSNEASDNIIFDNEGPMVSSHTLRSTKSDKYGLVFKVYDKTSDGTSGIGVQSYSTQFGGGEWSDWQSPYKSTSYIWFNKTDQNEPITSGAIRFQDAYGNIGAPYSFEIIDRGLTDSEKADNDERGSEALDGEILINDGAIFTNSREVKVYLEANEGFSGNTRQQPEYYYLWEYPNPYTIENKHSYSGPITKDFTLSEGFGLKRLRARFKVDGAPSATGFDEIIYAPKYYVDYSNIKFLDKDNRAIDKPLELLAGEDLQIKLDLHNNGSETWRVNEEYTNTTPVNLSYHWYRIENGHPVQYEWNGTRSSLPNNVGYEQGVEGVNMHIDLPILAGEYLLRLDMVHEGVTWFSEVFNIMPEFNFTILDNPELPILSDQELGSVLGEYTGEFGIGDSTCNEIFIDICGSSFINYIKNLHRDDVINGDDQYDTNPQTFSPDRNMQRGQLAEWIVKGFGFDMDTSGRRFSDANSYTKTPYMDYIQALKNLGITNGFSDGTYRPNISITRAELATMLVRSMEKKGMVLDYSLWHNFDDMYNSAHEPYVAIITSTVVNGERIMSGFKSSNFGGGSYATRGQTTKALDLSRQFVPKDGVGTIIDTQGVNLYKEPSELSAVVGKLPYTDQVQILLQRMVANEVWLFVKGSSGIQGWTRSDNVYKPTGYTYPIDENYNIFESGNICNDSEIGLYEQPNWGSRLIKTLSKHTNLNIIEVNGDWRKVVLVGRTSGTGWVHKAYVCEGYSGGPEYFGLLGFTKPLDPQASLESLFGPREGGFHYATDYGIECGSPVYAIQSGVVIAMSDNGVVAGNNSTPETPVSYVIIEHENGYISSYFHLNTVEVEVGERLSKGQFIGTVGNTGYVRGNPDHPIEKQGCHLHFEIREVNNDPSDIWEYLFARNPLEVFQTEISPLLKKWIEDLKKKFFGADISDEEIVNNVEFGVGNVPDVCLNPYQNKSREEEEEEDDQDEIDAPDTKITFTKNSSSMISQKTKIIYEETYVAPPEITGVKMTKDGKYATVYGYGMQKGKEIDIKMYNYELTDCSMGIICNPITKTYETKQPITETRILLYVNQDKRFLGWTNQVNADGSWHITIPLADAEVGINSLIWAKTEVFIKYEYPLPMYPWFTRNVEFDIKKIGDGEGVKSDYGTSSYLFSSAACDFVPPENTDCRLQGSPFSDVCPSSPYYESIVGLRGFDTNLDGVIQESEIIINGFSDMSFRPDMKVTRGQMAKFIVNGYNLDESLGCGDFQDVDESDVFYDYIMTLKCNGIVNGYSDGSYKPDEYITRSQIAKVIVTAMEEKYHTNFATIGFSQAISFKDIASTDSSKRDIGLLSNFKKDGEYISEWKGENFGGNITINRAELSRLIYMTKPIILDVPYFNQLKDLDGTENPIGGEKMCGAASAVMASGYHGYLDYDSGDNLKINVYDDNEQGIDKKCTVKNHASKEYEVTGAFAMTSNEKCSWTYSNGMARYIGRSSVPNYTAGIALDVDGIQLRENSDKGRLDFTEVVDLIKSTEPLVTSFHWDYSKTNGHIIIVKGYGVDELIIVNDPYQSLAIDGRNANYTLNGHGAGYRLSDNELNSTYPINYAVTY
jgi:uncharacterized repeat protein (TIGR01451 family)